MKHLLFLAHRIPYPPNKGDKIRSWHLLKHLAQRYRVHLGAFIDDPADWQHVDTVRQSCAQTCFVPLNPRGARLRSLVALAANRPLGVDYYHDSRMREWVRQVLRQLPVGRILVFSAAMAQYAMEAGAARRLIDFVDVDSEKWAQYANGKPWPMRWLYRREARTLLEYERGVAARFDASLFVSQQEAALFCERAPECAPRVGFFSNGVDAGYFSPNHVLSSPYQPRERAIVFTGAMDYWPNVDAVQWFAREVMPGILAAHPAAAFWVVGARPTREVQALAALPGVRVTGMVPDVRPYLSHARLVVAPLRIARGIQNKVLEAMAMAKPVLATPQALEGIDAEPEREAVQATDAAQFIAHACELLTGKGLGLGEEIGRAARRKVLACYDWSGNLAGIEALLEGEARCACGQHGAAAPALPAAAPSSGPATEGAPS